MKKQRDIINIRGKGFCFPAALYNAFPKIFNDENELKEICNKFVNESHDIEFYFDYFNNYISKKSDCKLDELSLKKFITKQNTYQEFLQYLIKNKNNVMILGLNNLKNTERYHVVTFTGYDNSKGVIYFENGNNEVLLIELLNGLCKKPFRPIYDSDMEFLKNRKDISHDVLREYLENKYTYKINEFTCIDPKLLYNYSQEIYFITLTHSDSVLKNFTSRLTKTLLPKNSYFISEEEIMEEYEQCKKENVMIPIIMS